MPGVPMTAIEGYAKSADTSQKALLALSTLIIVVCLTQDNGLTDAIDKLTALRNSLDGSSHRTFVEEELRAHGEHSIVRQKLVDNLSIDNPIVHLDEYKRNTKIGDILGIQSWDDYSTHPLKSFVILLNHQPLRSTSRTHGFS